MNNRIKELRLEYGVSQKELASLIGVSSATISMWESGKRNPKEFYLHRMSDLFKVSIDYILFKTNIKNFDINSIEAISNALLDNNIRLVTSIVKNFFLDANIPQNYKDDLLNNVIQFYNYSKENNKHGM